MKESRVVSTVADAGVSGIRCCVTDLPAWGSCKEGIGSESTVNEYADAVVSLLRPVRSLLAHDGLLWVRVTDATVPIPTVTLDEKDAELWRNARAAGVKQLLCDKSKDSPHTEMITQASERLVRAWLGLPNPVRRHDKPDDGDVKIGGKRWNVKHSWSHDNNLICNVDHMRDKDDGYILVTGATPEDLWIRGYATKEELMEEKWEGEHAPHYFRSRHKLHPFDDLVKMNVRRRPTESAFVPWGVLQGLRVDEWFYRGAYGTDEEGQWRPVLLFTRTLGIRFNHPAPGVFPHRYIEASSRQGEWVIDPLAGIGDAIAPAFAMGRNVVAVQPDEAKARAIRERLTPTPDPLKAGPLMFGDAAKDGMFRETDK